MILWSICELVGGNASLGLGFGFQKLMTGLVSVSFFLHVLDKK